MTFKGNWCKTATLRYYCRIPPVNPTKTLQPGVPLNDAHSYNWQEIDVSLQSKSGVNVLMLAAEKSSPGNDGLRLITDILGRSSTSSGGREGLVRSVDCRGMTPIIHASSGGNKDVVEVIIEAGADLNQCDQDGVSALYMAAQNGHFEAVKLLLSNGAQVYIML